MQQSTQLNKAYWIRITEETLIITVKLKTGLVVFFLQFHDIQCHIINTTENIMHIKLSVNTQLTLLVIHVFQTCKCVPNV